jgi:hypothetical protein
MQPYGDTDTELRSEYPDRDPDRDPGRGPCHASFLILHVNGHRVVLDTGTAFLAIILPDCCSHASATRTSFQQSFFTRLALFDAFFYLIRGLVWYDYRLHHAQTPLIPETGARSTPPPKDEVPSFKSQTESDSPIKQIRDSHCTAAKRACIMVSLATHVQPSTDMGPSRLVHCTTYVFTHPVP